MRHPPFRVAALSLLALAAASGAAAAQPNAIAPGYWETTSGVASPVHTSKVERRCIRPADVAKFMNGPSNHIYTCTYPVRVVGDGAIHLQGSCATRTGKPIPVRGDGVFTRETFHFDGHFPAQLGPLQVPVHVVSDARRLSADCPLPPPADSKPSADPKPATAE